MLIGWLSVWPPSFRSCAMYEALWGLREPESRRARQDRAEGAPGPGAGGVFLPLSGSSSGHS